MTKRISATRLLMGGNAITITPLHQTKPPSPWVYFENYNQRTTAVNGGHRGGSGRFAGPVSHQAPTGSEEFSSTNERSLGATRSYWRLLEVTRETLIGDMATTDPPLNR